MVEQVLAVRLGVLQHAPVDQLGVGGEAPLRAGHGDGPSDVAAAV
jgi:hypothetical protein